jgi:glycosyltransferase involved in cell wall biosynthesis
VHISYNTTESAFDITVGYGQAGKGVIESLQKLGHLVTLNNPKAPIQLNFIQPIHYKFNKTNQYRIGYTPWESTELPIGWLENFNKCNEVWTTSPLIAAWYKKCGVKPKIKVYEHGLHDIWKDTRLHQKQDDVFRFLHIGEPAPRKGGDIVVETFIELFGDNPKYQLTIKANEFLTMRPKDIFGKRYKLSDYSNIKIVSKQYTDDQMVKIMHMHDCLIYPSWGEGFGFIPLQAISLGLPTICVDAWAPYSDFITLNLNSTLTSSPWPLMHPGLMFEPDRQHLKQLMLEIIENYDKYAIKTFKNSLLVQEKYDWIKLTKEAFLDLEKNL